MLRSINPGLGACYRPKQAVTLLRRHETRHFESTLVAAIASQLSFGPPRVTFSRMPRPLNGNSVTMEDPYWALRLSSAALNACMSLAVARCLKSFKGIRKARAGSVNVCRRFQNTVSLQPIVEAETIELLYRSRRVLTSPLS